MSARAISGTRRAFKELVDGTLRVQIDVDPESRRDFLRLFSDIDMRVAIAPLKASAKADDALKGGELAKLAGIFCGDPLFLAWIMHRYPEHAENAPAAGAGVGPDLAAHIVRAVCGVSSRAELDHNPVAAERFHDMVRRPWAERNT